METIELLARFADPHVIKSLPLADRLFAGLMTTLLGMGITFIALVLLQCIIVVMTKLNLSDTQPARQAVREETVEKAAQDHSAELIAAITAALALQLRTSTSRIVIRNIEKVETSPSAWQKAGIAEHMHNSL